MANWVYHLDCRIATCNNDDDDDDDNVDDDNVDDDDDDEVEGDDPAISVCIGGVVRPYAKERKTF
jgi:hypothetical protein